jgi:hypothetical protein
MSNNPHKQKIGCLVPLCQHGWCTRSKKKLCALRKFFLIIQKERRKDLRMQKFSYLSKEAEKLLRKEIYFWKDQGKLK